MADAKAAKPDAKVKKAKREADPEKKRLVQTMGRALWSVYLASDEQKLDAEQKKASWKEHRKAYVHMAKGLVRRLETKGVNMTQAPKVKKAEKA